MQSGPPLQIGREGVEPVGALPLSPQLAALFENRFYVHFSVPIHWGEQDAFGHVNNVRYLSYFEAYVFCALRLDKAVRCTE